MLIGRFWLGRRVFYGVVYGDEVAEVSGSIFRKFRITGHRQPLSALKVLPPTQPIQIWCPGLNFLDHLSYAQSVLGEKMQKPHHPEPWLKARSSLIGYEDKIIIPRESGGEVHYEGEAVAVIGRTCRRISPKDAWRYILGYTCGNDVSERVWQKTDHSFWRAKGSDTFCPVGPWIQTEADPLNMEMVVKLNGREVQRANTKDMIFSFAEVISYITQHATLYPGDLVFSGTTATTSAMKAGDIVEVEITGIGTLRNPVVNEA